MIGRGWFIARKSNQQS